MSVAVLCNLSDGVIIGVDSAVTVSDANGVRKVFADGEKLFQLTDRVGVATYGVGGLEGRSIGSFVREFELAHPDLSNIPLQETVELLRQFFMGVYVRSAEYIYGLPFDQIPAEEKGVLGFIVAGFSPGQYLSEAWHLQLPWNNDPNSAEHICAPGNFQVSWYATFGPIERYIKGCDRNLFAEMTTLAATIAGRLLTEEEVNQFVEIVDKHSYRAFLDSMPVQAGIDYVRFLVNLVIEHYRLISQHPIVGGKPKIGVVTYKGEKFKLIE